MRRCLSRALAHRSSGLTPLAAYASALHQGNVCYSGAERTEAWWGLLGVGVLIAAAGAIFLAQPWWYRRRMHLSELGGDGAAALMSRLEGVRQRAGTGPVIWLLQPLNVHLSAFAFGRPRRRFVAVSGGAAVAAVRKPAAFDAVILHELAHIKNRDIDQTYLALAIWRAFVVTALLPMAGLLIFTRELGAAVALARGRAGPDRLLAPQHDPAVTRIRRGRARPGTRPGHQPHGRGMAVHDGRPAARPTLCANRPSKQEVSSGPGEAGRRAISGPLAQVKNGLSRSLLDDQFRSSGRIRAQTSQIPSR